ncbi:hypothetical protein SYNPS1DRAFT_26948 [Syncephalis pseudoplumigaleata]|uniref:Extracellular membrane protein CFEM domain-containing protein n=1 Tax=Syncephalis pseudoplumigaleata TaxID=1712513 RepID=A0A4V1J256_9FUNG|nr:hypothetical protein SYNPS1DRAFT_26948 [Syncephalis pseudoplumigaleata]|eukprot:RKP27389.1 hypothetical protein SYNPS1DRAFT_26948 [Syncephalis pseudoplumigaleata]
MKLISVLLALNALAAVQLVAADCSDDVVAQCEGDINRLIESCQDDKVCKCMRHKDMPSCYNGCTSEEYKGKKKQSEGLVLIYCQGLPTTTSSSSSSKPTSTSSSSSSSTSTPASTSTNAAAAAHTASNGWLAGVAAVAGAVAYYA